MQQQELRTKKQKKLKMQDQLKAIQFTMVGAQQELERTKISII